MLTRRAALALVTAITGASGASAADKLVLAPPAAWVRPVPPPAAGKPDGAAVHLILADQQVDLEPHAQTRYFENVARIQTPQGLSGANISFAWNPDTSTATVHKLLIRRGDKVIDVLATQSFTVVRRESNLEAAMIDGVLTATIQPEGVQVGDVIDFAASITEHDPAMQAHVEEIGGAWNGAPVDLAHMRVQWPSTVPVRTRETEGLPPLKVARVGGMASTELTLPDLQPIAPAKGAPLRYAALRLVEMSDFASWSDLAALMAPLYDKAATLPAKGALAGEIATIAAQSPDPKARAQAALALVQDRVRYVFLGMNDGGLVPADAETTWSRRFGDCKGKTALLLALLKGLGIAAQPVIVNAIAGDGIDQRLPMIAPFNHVLVRATIAGRVYWLDGTRQGDTDLDAIKTPDFRWGLPLAAGATLIAIDRPPPDRPMVETAIRIDATGGLSIPAPTHIETIWRDDLAVAFNLQLANLTPEIRDSGLKTFWRKQYDFLDPATVSVSFDPVKREEHFVVDGTARMDWPNGWYEADGVGVGYKPDFSRDPAPDHDAPFAVVYPSYTRSQETVLLPPGAFRLDHADPVDMTVAGVAYHRTATLAGNRFTVEQTERSLAREFPASDAPAAAATLRDLADRNVFIGRPENYRRTDKELTAALATPPTTAGGFIDLGNDLLMRARYGEAIDALDKALALDPKNVIALADRAFAYQGKGDNAAARRDVAAALAIDPQSPVAERAQGVVADAQGAPRDAVAAYTKSLQTDPGNLFALDHLARAEYATGDDDHALDHAAQAIRQNPHAIPLYLLRANIFRRMGRTDDALHEAVAVTAANPDSDYAHVVAARIYGKYGRNDEALREFDRALAISHASFIYVNRANMRGRGDLAARQADLDAAAKSDPKSTDVLFEQARLREDRQDYAGAIAALSAVIAQKPTDSIALGYRGVDYQRLGRAALAEKDFAAARLNATRPELLNALCWAKATASVALDSALADCDAALAKAPETPAYLDSRAFTLFRMGRLDEALAGYDKVLAKSPRLAASRYGRAVIEARKGEIDKSNADLAAALKIDPDAVDEFARYGVVIAAPAATLPPAKTASAH